MSSAGEPRPEASVLERNLELLFEHAYAPVEPSVPFRQALRRTLEQAIVAHALPSSTRRAASSAARIAGPRRWYFRAAAALLLAVLGISAWKMLARSEPVESRASRLERIARSGRTAIATDGLDAVRAVSDTEAARGLDYSGPMLTAWTAPSSELSIWLGAAGRVLERSATRIDLAGPPSSELRLDLGSGAIEVERYAAGAAWRIQTREGTLALERGTLLVADMVPRSGAATGARAVQALLRSGSAYLEANGARLALALGAETEIRGGELSAVNEPMGSATSASARTTLGDPSAKTAPDLEPASPPTAALRGHISIPQGSPPLARYSVTLLRDERLPRVAQPEVHAIEDGRAEFELTGLRSGTYTVFVESPGFAVWQRRGVGLSTSGAASDLAIALERGLHLRGRVIDAVSGRPIEGAVVISQRDAPTQLLPLDMERAPEGWIAATSSGPDGSFELDALSRGAHRLRATHSGFGAAWSEPLDASPDPLRDPVELRLQRGGTIFGHVTHKDGAPWGAARVIASWISYDFEEHCMSYGMAVADAEGAYAIEDLPAGPYAVLNVLEAVEDHVASPHVAQVNVAVGGRVELDIGAGRKGTRLSGRMLAAANAEVAGLDVILEPHGTRNVRKWQSERAGEDGRFRFVDLAPGAYDVYAGEEMGRRFVLQEVIDVPAVPEFAYELRLGAGAIEGRIVDAASDRGLPNCVLVLQVGEEGARKFAGRAVTDSEGRYSLHHMPPGTYRLAAYATTGRFAPEVREGLRIGDTAPAIALDIRLSAGAALEVRVLSPDGHPIQGADVTFSDESGRSLQFTPEDITDARGKLWVSGIMPGRWHIAATSPGCNSGAKTVDLEVGSESTVEIVLTPQAPR